VVLAQPEFFPDPFQGTEEDARRMLDRVCEYMEIDPATVEMALYVDRNPVHEGPWRQATAGLYRQEQGKFLIWIEANNLADPLSMVATMAHELGHVHLLGHGRIGDEAEDHEPLTDLLTVFLGLGVLTANSVIREKNWHAGQVSGWSMSRRGYLTMPMYGYALALFARLRSEQRPTWARHLRPDVRSAFGQASLFLSEGLGEPHRHATVVPEEEATEDVEESESEQQDEEFAPAEEDVQQPSLGAEELLDRYASGDRDFRRLDLQGLSLRGVDLSACNLAGADLSEADLTEAILADAGLRDADLQSCRLHRTVLRGSDLRGADLSDSDLSGADLSQADIRGADFTGCDLRGTILVQTLRNRHTNFEGQDLSEAICDADFSAEDLQGATPYQQQAEQFGRLQRLVALLFVIALAAGIGAGLLGLAAEAVGRQLDESELGYCGALIGAGVFGWLAAWKLVSPHS
jgi:uncharacterized protein YjbI with pentapeptide repeats